MSSVVYSGETRGAGASFGVGCVAGLAAVIGVIGAVSLVMLLSGEAMVPSLAATVRIAGPLGIVLAVALGAWALRIHRASARTLTIRRAKDGAHAFEIPPDVSFEGQLSCDHGWQTGMSHGAVRTKLLWCDVRCDGELMLRLSYEIGALYEVPPGWTEVQASFDAPAKFGGFTLSDLPRVVELLHEGQKP